METLQSLSHSRWACKFHVVWIPKCRKKKLYGPLRKELGAVFHELARQKECQVIEGHLLLDHVHMLISIPPKYAVSRVVFYQGEECDSCGVDLWAKEKLYRSVFLGSGVLCIDDG